MTTIDERHEEGARGGKEPRGGASGVRVMAVSRLDEPTAALPHLAGSKAARLARAAGAGLPVLPGFVIPCSVHGVGGGALRHAWQMLSEGGALALVVRSSSPQEDAHESSWAGRFASVCDVRGWEEFLAAVRTVLDSAHRPDGATAPMAVLVQPMLTARVGGVLFGAAPVEGRTDRMLVSAVRGGPGTLVGGEQQGRTLAGDPDALLTRSDLRRLADLAHRAHRLLGGPQDIEFAFDPDGRLWLLQSRPITAMAAQPPHGARLLGPGPVAEALPDQ